jgi:2-polyprenyl-6-methoxyphenol hydroxylase-like FAD-dependent oxidoreductase
MLGYMLARAGIETTVLEKWPDFFRDFRGDTIHPSVMEILHELELLEDFLKLPHDELQQVEAQFGEEKLIMSDFSHLKVHCPFIAFIPQWDFLNFIAGKAGKYPTFHLLMETEATDVIKEGGKIVGVKAKSKGEDIEIRSDLLVAADGRHSTVRDKSGLIPKATGAPMDVLWFRISRKDGDATAIMGKFDLGRIVIMINRGSYWQCGFLIRKGQFENIKQKGIDMFQQSIAEVLPNFAERAKEIKEWDQVKLLTVTVNHLAKWYSRGLLCIGDSAHAMSPIGGVGINLAIQDAVAAANILVPAFIKGNVLESDLKKVQKRRKLPVKIIQRVQVFMQNNIVDSILGNNIHPKLPLPLKIIKRFPYFSRVPGYMVGIGFRPEHVKTGNAYSSKRNPAGK